MRHGKKFNHLGRKASHRKAMLANMACSLIQHKRIKTTLAKAKSLRKYIEPLITKSKNDTTHSRRIVFSYLKQKEAITELFGEVSSKISERSGGYTRILKLGNRLGDNAQMALIELVDYNDTYVTDQTKKKKKTRRRGGSKSNTSSETKTDVTPDVKEEVSSDTTTDVTPETKTDVTPDVKEEVSSETKTDVTPDVKEEAPAEENTEVVNDMKKDESFDESSEEEKVD